MSDLTKDDVMSLEGRELDAAVAEHVMGYPVVRMPYREQDVPDVFPWACLVPAVDEDDRDEHERMFLHTPETYSSSGWSSPFWHPSDRLEDAWKVWQKVGGGIISGNDQDGYRVAELAGARIDITLVAGKYATGYEPWDDEPLVLGETAPLAICRAALLAALKPEPKDL